jgi:hypothetical protein
MDLSPKIVTMFTPSNRAEQEKKFLSGEVRNSQLVYEKLGAADFGAAIKNIQQLGDSILNHPDLPSRYRKVYEEFIKSKLSFFFARRCITSSDRRKIGKILLRRTKV